MARWDGVLGVLFCASVGAVVVHVVIVGGPVADAVLGWGRIGLCVNLMLWPEAHVAANEVSLWARYAVNEHGRLAYDLSGGIGCV